jgi:uncharacterized protein (DUF1800 family)
VSIEAAIAANRFGLGARPGEIAAIGSDSRGWLAAQVQGSRPVPSDLQALADSASAFKAYAQARKERRERSASETAPAQTPPARPPLLTLYYEQVAARYAWAVTTEESFRERLVHFWANHFAVSVEKQQVLALAGTLENEAIRPHIAAKFSVMLQAVEAHPAMIFYLDNQGSVGPSSRVAKRRAVRESGNRKGDINENLAREILELHTLGVGGGYSQSDVTAFARVLTGWTVASAGEAAGKFLFRDAAHEPGDATILGVRYAEGGVEQGQAVLDALARHPATAMHLATKLVRHFVADVPPPAAVAEISKAFRDSDGDLPTVHRALIGLAQAWQPAPAKFKTPHEFVVSVWRSLDFVPRKPGSSAGTLRALGQRAYAADSPAGWPDIAAAWDGPDALLDRIDWTAQLGARFGVRRQPLELAQEALGDALSERTRDAIALAADGAQGLTLLFASPDFLRR